MLPNGTLAVRGLIALIGNPILTSLDGETRAPLRTLLADSFTAQDRAAYGLYLVDTTPPEGKRWAGTFEDVGGVPVAVFEDLPPPSTDDVNAERDRRLEAGSAFTVAGVADPIPLQGREFDRTVYLALLTRAQGYKAAGVTDPVLKIRAADDVTHNLTPDQMISLVTQSMNWFEDVMATSWHMKDATGDFPDGIPADYADDTHWP